MVKNDCSYYCARCSKKFVRVAAFKKHTIEQGEPNNRCVTKFPPIDWSIYCGDAEKQIAFYKKHKKFKYNNEAPTAEQVAKLMDNSSNIHAILRYSHQKPFYQTIINKFFKKKIAAGYEVITVSRGYHEWERQEFKYLVKDNVIYTPYAKHKNLIQCGVVEPTYFNPTDIRITDSDGIEYYTRYKKYASSAADPFRSNDAEVLNFYKIDETSVVHIDEHDRVYVDPGEDIDVPMLCFKIQADPTVYSPNTDKRAPYGVTGCYYNVTFNRNRKTFIKHEKPIHKLVSDCTYNRSHYMNVFRARHREKGILKDDDTDTCEETKKVIE